MSAERDELAGWRDAEAHSDFTLELPNKGGPMFFREIPAGEFLMGSRAQDHDEEPRHLVRMPRAFWMATFPVTQRQFRAFTAATKLKHSDEFSGSEYLPAESMDWEKALGFCDWLGKLRKQLHGRTPSLPTETEWEYACRAGTSTEYWSGDGEAALGKVGWFENNAKGRTHVVGEIGPSGASPWGLYDMHGNVWEWCVDRWDEDAYRGRLDGDEDVSRALADPSDRQSFRVIRGGSWSNSARFCRSACRDRWWPVIRFRGQGFRVCLLPGPVVEPASKPAKARDEGRARGGTTRSRPQSSAGAADQRKSSSRTRKPSGERRSDTAMEQEQ